jgi:hypothetical protein
VVVLPGDRVAVVGDDARGGPGTWRDCQSGPALSDVVVWRFLADLSPDQARPVTMTDLGRYETVTGAVAAPDGDVVVHGVRSAVDECQRVVAPHEPMVVRLRPDGSGEPSFGFGGIVLGGPTQVATALLQPDGKALLYGTADGAIAVTRRHAEGRPDEPFGHQGTQRDPLRDGPSEIVAAGFLPDGDVLAVGRYGPHGQPRGVLVRYNP